MKTSRRSNTSSGVEPVRLNNIQTSEIAKFRGLKRKLDAELSKIKESNGKSEDVSLEKLLAVVKPKVKPLETPLVTTLEAAYAGRSIKDLRQDLIQINKFRRSPQKAVEDEASLRILNKLGVTTDKGESENAQHHRSRVAEEKSESESDQSGAPAGMQKDDVRTNKPRKKKTSKVAIRKSQSKSHAKPKAKPLPKPRARAEAAVPARKSSRAGLLRPVKAPEDVKILDGSLIEQLPIEAEAILPVPRLSFDLSRVLFNPGVYHLQDPRSRVYNFDPYLEKIMPVSEFNFGALNPYVTSSEDNHLRNVSLKHNKRYIGSSSSMSGAMSQFHFLLSAWRPLNMSMLSTKIKGSENFTLITRAPSSIFLRWRDGVYAVDADKEHDTPNILMMQGKSMEKLLTLEKEDFERYRKPKAGEAAPAIDSDPESYHYSSCEDFLLRSQLDAWDPRLPGTGMFDLKTRACAGIRMDMGNHEHGMGYQIKQRFGEWESFDREYFDMMRSAFLKYSLQVRMGRMDGIFVAYHNIERIFGFQYIPLSELDAGLHGQTDPSLGDQEFRTTVKLMNQVFDLATKEFPKQSLRFLFETRESTKTDPNGVMYIFAQPMSEESIDKIQKAGKAKVEEYEKNMAKGASSSEGERLGGQTLEAKLSPSTLESNSADLAFLEEIMKPTEDSEAEALLRQEEGPIACWKLRIFNEVDGRAVVRPQDISASNRWTVKYQIDRVGDAQARSRYEICQRHRASTLSWDLEAKKQSYFIRMIQKMSAQGRTWREEQDELDAQREKVVLYQPAAVRSHK